VLNMAGHSEVKTRKIRAAVLRKRGGPLKIESLEMEGPLEDEILVRIVATGICHTDIDFVDEWDESDTPVVLGHEGAGIVEQIGAGVKGIRPGDHVVLSYQSCGRCASCRKGRPTECDGLSEANFGFQRLDGTNALAGNGVRGHFFGQSSFSTHILATGRNMVQVSKDLPLEVLAPLGCGIQAGAGTVMNSLRVSKGQGIAVFGTGAVGLASVMAARIVGAHPIIGVDQVPMRLERALELGATHVIDNRHRNVASRVSGITGRGVDFVVETTAASDMHRLAVDLLNPNGTAAFLTGEPGRDFSEGRKTIGIIAGDAVPQRFIPKLIELYQAGAFPFDRLITFYQFKEINRAISDARRGETIKPVLRVSRP
jgi:aryl-alcohol dehydrogenase